MVSAEALVRGSRKTEALMARFDGEEQYGVQLFGGDPGVMGHAARLCAEKASPTLIDVNAGCPVPKIIKSGAGAALTRDPKRLGEVVRAMVTAVPGTPITVKIRSGWDAGHLCWQEAALAAIEAGAAALTMHPRTKAQGYEGKADWDVLAALVALAAGRARVFGSGDVWTAEDARRMLAETGADGVFFARGALGNPGVFGEAKALLTGGEERELTTNDTNRTNREKIEAALEELRLLVADQGEARACVNMRKRFVAYLHGISGAAGLRARAVAAERVSDYEGIVREIL
jgi:nifR3 family TIM-barrel protein